MKKAKKNVVVVSVNSPDKDYMLKRGWSAEGSPNFSATHNKKVVEDTIKQYDKMRKKALKKYEDDVGERADAVSFYLKNLANGNTSSEVEKYFARKELAYLHGRKIMGQVIDYIDGKPLYRLEELN